MKPGAPAMDSAGSTPGADLLAQVDLGAVDARLSALPTAALLAELEAIVTAIDNTDPARRRRRAGFFGRLMGRDLVAAAQPDQAETRVRLHLQSAQALAQTLERQAAELVPVAADLREHGAQLHALIATHLSSDAASTRRMQHLAAVAATWDTAVAQIDLMREHAGHLLARHAQVRDVLVPAWRQRASLDHAHARGDADAVTQLHESVRAQLTLLHDALQRPQPLSDTQRTATAPDAIDTGHATKEPSP